MDSIELAKHVIDNSFDVIQIQLAKEVLKLNRVEYTKPIQPEEPSVA